jgi:hypothetical protein
VTRSASVLPSFADSIAEYEGWMRKLLGDWLVEKGLERKHKRMRDHPFLFLRATCWRWAEAADFLCPELSDAPRVPSVGDAHAGNFGLWRDAGSRLVWGVNDYDEAARLPWCLDLVRLTASIQLAIPEWSAHAIADAALAGYEAALPAPQPFVMERDHLWLRDAFASSDKHRAEFWEELEAAKPARDVPDELREVMLKALPERGLKPRIAAREAGAGSLGRPRFVALAEHRGGPVAIEVKGLLPSCWKAGREAGIAQAMATSRFRSPDPAFRYRKRHVVRRLAPNSRKLTLDEVGGAMLRQLIGAMAADLAALHSAEEASRKPLAKDFAKRPAGWLHDAATRVAAWTSEEQARYVEDTG